MKHTRNILAAITATALTCGTLITSAQGLSGDKDKQSNGKSKSTAFSSDYEWGIGIRLGDPTGITVKKYFGDNALELSFGRAHTIGRRDYWNKRYRDKWEGKYDKSSYKEIDYLGYSSSPPLSFQLHYLWQKNIPDLEGLAWYYGVGGQLAFQTIRYDYRYKRQGSDDWIYDDGGTLLDMDFGGDGVIGLEYAFSDVPISLFLDLTIFMEVYDNPFVFWFQSGIGGRYNF